MPMAIMTSQTIPSPLFYVMAAFAIAIIALANKNNIKQEFKNNRMLFLCMGTPLIALLISSAVHGKLVGLDLEVSLRIFLGTIFLALAFFTIDKKLLQKTSWGFIAAGLIASCYIFYLLVIGGDGYVSDGRPQTSAVYNAVGYGSLTALLMTITLFSIAIPTTKYSRLELIIKIAIVVIALIATILTKTRTAWMAMPVFILIAVILFVPVKGQINKVSKKLIIKISSIFIIALIAITAFLASNHAMRDRVVLAYDEAISCVGEQSTTDSSICIRLQLWRASLDMLAERPFSGNGSKRYFNDYLQQESYPKGIVSPYVAENWGEPHNDILLAASSFGILGAIALLIIYLAPTGIFIRRLSYKYPSEIRAAAAMGVCFCLGFMIFGFTETMFRSMRTVSFYAMGIAFFMALSKPNK